MKKLLPAAIVLFFAITALAQDSTSAKPSLRFNPAKIKDFGDQFLPGGPGGDGNNDNIYWSYDKSPLPNVGIYEPPGSKEPAQGIYLGYDQYGSYQKSGIDGKYKRWDGEKLVTVDKVPENLYNDPQKKNIADYESIHGKGSAAKDAAASHYTPPDNNAAVVVPTTADFNGSDALGIIKMVGGKDTLEHKVFRPSLFLNKFEKGAGPYVEKAKNGFVMWSLSGDGGYGISPLTAEIVKELELDKNTVQK